MDKYKRYSFWGYTGSVEQIAASHSRSNSIIIDLDTPLSEQNFTRGIGHPHQYDTKPYIAPRFADAIASFDKVAFKELSIEEQIEKYAKFMTSHSLPDETEIAVPPSQEQKAQPAPSA